MTGLTRPLIRWIGHDQLISYPWSIRIKVTLRRYRNDIVKNSRIWAAESILHGRTITQTEVQSAPGVHSQTSSHPAISLMFTVFSGSNHSNEMFPRTPPGHSFDADLSLPRSSSIATANRLIWSRRSSDPPKSYLARGKFLNESLHVVESAKGN